jgi:ABC-type tungstate transport system substrate-binding protein
MVAKVLRWIIFGAIVSLLPLAVAWVTLALTSAAQPPQNPDLASVLGNGELLVVVWVLSASRSANCSAAAQIFGIPRSSSAALRL